MRLFPGYNDLEEEGRFVDPYTNEVMNSSYWALHEPNNWGVGEDCTEVQEDLTLNDKGGCCVGLDSVHHAGLEIFKHLTAGVMVNVGGSSEDRFRHDDHCPPDSPHPCLLLRVRHQEMCLLQSTKEPPV